MNKLIKIPNWKKRFRELTKRSQYIEYSRIEEFIGKEIKVAEVRGRNGVWYVKLLLKLKKFLKR